MNIGFWNIRGVGKTCLWEELSYVRKFNKINILVLLETKTSIKPSIASMLGPDRYQFLRVLVEIW